IAEALAMLANIVARDNDPGWDIVKRLERFMSHKPTIFTGRYNPEGAIKWIEEVEIIFEAMDCTEESKTTLGTTCCVRKQITGGGTLS
ncbi:cellular nucleic acid-binding protein, partial [Trifolium medium]|nr:cellular nucleic acid-binding protein [Trifolium medium]